MYFKEQPKTRKKQVEYLRSLLMKKFTVLYPTYESLEKHIISENVKRKKPILLHSYKHAQTTFAYMELHKFINPKDNSLRGFKTKCTADFN